MSGILRPEAGEVRYNGLRLDDLAEAPRTRLRRREFGIVLQFGQLVPELTVEQNVALPILLEGHDRSAARTAARAWLDRLDVGQLAAGLPGELSGGERQRAALARALVTGPQVVFADEPTGALDTVGGDALLAVLLSTARDRGASVVLVTHDNRVAAHADREVVLVDGAFTLAGVLLVVLGAIALAPWVALRAGQRAARHTSDPATLIAAAHLVADPRPAGRAAAAIGAIGIVSGAAAVIEADVLFS
jgi:putative ABC transport system ATP-binding protein